MCRVVRQLVLTVNGVCEPRYPILEAELLTTYHKLRKLVKYYPIAKARTSPNSCTSLVHESPASVLR